MNCELLHQTVVCSPSFEHLWTWFWSDMLHTPWATQLMLCPSGSSDKWTNQTLDQRSHIQVPWLCMEIRPSPCLCIDESTSASSPTSAWDFPQVAWHFIGKYFHLQHIIYCSLSPSLTRSLTAIASHRLWQRPLQIALMGEFWAHSSSKDRFTLCQKR